MAHPLDGAGYDDEYVVQTANTTRTDYAIDAYDALVLAILDIVDELQREATDLRNDAQLEAEILKARAGDLLDLINGNRE